MQTSPFIEAVKKSLDNDLSDMVYSSEVSVSDAILLQMLRIMRGRPFRIELQEPQDGTTGWTPDGVNWYPAEPGTRTTGGGFVPPGKGE